MYVFIRSRVLLWREVWSKLFKLTRTLFSFRSGTLSSGAVCSLHPRILLPPPPSVPFSIGWFHRPRLDRFVLSSSILFLFSFTFVPASSLLLRVASILSSSHCPITRCRIWDSDCSSIIFPADDLITLRSTWWNSDFSAVPPCVVLSRLLD